MEGIAVLLLSAVLISGLVTLAALCLCLVRGQGSAHRQLALWAFGLALVLGIRFAGGAALTIAGLGWRSWVRGALALAALVLGFLVLQGIFRVLLDLPLAGWVQAVSGMCCALTGATAIGVAAALLLFGHPSERIATVNGEQLVIESSGIFHETGYQYRNLFLHGAKLYEWQD